MNTKRILFLFIILLFLYCSRVFAVEVTSPNAILIDSSSGKILFEKNAYDTVFPASTTKIMTAIIVLESCQLEDLVTVDYSALIEIPRGYSIANLQHGEQLTVEQLLNVLLISSANDAATVLAQHTAGSLESFTSIMNTKALELGCKNTHFVNANGIHNDSHYSTAYDLALISKYAMKNSAFRNFVARTYCSLPNMYSGYARNFYATNELLLENSGNFYKYAIGIKTGYTTPAKNCLVSAALNDGLELISVVLGNEDSDSRFQDAKNLFYYGYENYYLKNLHKSNDILKEIEIPNATLETKKLGLKIEKDINVLLSYENSNTKLEPTIVLKSNSFANIEKDEVVGKIVYSIDGITYESNLLAEHEVVKKDIFEIIFYILFVILIGFVTYEIFFRKKHEEI